jgi:hypothetical protein
LAVDRDVSCCGWSFLVADLGIFPTWQLRSTDKSLKMGSCCNGYVFAGLRSGLIGMSGIDHPKPIRLFDLSQGTGKPTEEEKLHVRNCEECQHIVAVFARQFTLENPPKDKPENAA